MDGEKVKGKMKNIQIFMLLRRKREEEVKNGGLVGKENKDN